MKRRVRQILNKPYGRILIPDDDGTYTAEILEFPGCYGEGDTAADAINDLEQAAASWIEAAIKQGQGIPAPLDSCEYSGKINLRLPKSIHKQAVRFAERDDISLNQFFLSAIAARIGAEELYSCLLQRLQIPPAFNVTVMNVPPSSNVDFLVQTEKLQLSLECKQTEEVLPAPPASLESMKVLSNA